MGRFEGVGRYMTEFAEKEKNEVDFSSARFDHTDSSCDPYPCQPFHGSGFVPH